MLSFMKSWFVCAAVVASFALTSRASDWPQWRGVNRDGHAAPGAAAISSLEKDLKPVWKQAIGPGFSSPIVAHGKLIFLDARQAEEPGRTNEVVHCVDASSGKELWSRPFAAAFGDEWGTGPRSTPFVEGDRVYVQSMSGEFYCLKLNAPVMVEVERDGVIFARVYDIRGRSIRSLLTLPAP